MNKATIGLPLIIFPIILLLSYYVVTLASDYNKTQRSVMDFLNGNGELTGFNEVEIDHLYDVKKVMDITDIVFISLIVILLTLVYLLYNEMGKRVLIYTGASGVLITLVVIIVSVISFSFLFDIFHRPLFESGSWIFPADSFIIKTFPFQFFERIAKSILMVNLLLNVLLIAAWYIIKKRHETDNNN